eukprot:TRINITY_DN8047_c0_g1_i1.p1 TRINITY_DN8047_c0_g1~~TRINITY_DN8047_c0_g1_i1.p1  ORF type:complete len:308 (+),score=71.02 TRINITY_DN8047_c0_g1_i1:87-1010(+)
MPTIEISPDDLNRIVAGKTADGSTVVESFDTLEKDLLKVKCELQELESERNAYRSQMQKVRGEVGVLKLELESIRAENGKLTKENEQLKTRNSDLENAVTHMTKEETEANDEKQELLAALYPKMVTPAALQGVLPDYQTLSGADALDIADGALKTISGIEAALCAAVSNQRTDEELSAAQNEAIFVLCLVSHVSLMLSYVENIGLGVSDEPGSSPPPQKYRARLLQNRERFLKKFVPMSTRVKTTVGRLRCRIQSSSSPHGPLTSSVEKQVRSKSIPCVVSEQTNPTATSDDGEDYIGDNYTTINLS